MFNLCTMLYVMLTLFQGVDLSMHLYKVFAPASYVDSYGAFAMS